MTSTTGVLIGVDVGCTTSSAGLVTPQGEVLVSVQAPTDLGRGTAIQTILGLVTDLALEAQARGLTLEAVGVGVPGLVDVDRGMLLTSAAEHVADLHGVPLAERITEKTGVPTFLDNDVNAQALGEWKFGFGKGAASCVVLAIGTWIGAGLILDGRLIRGKSGYAGELGHGTIAFDGPPCPCGGRGCLGLYVSGQSIAEEARRRAASEPSSLPGRAGGHLDAITTETVFAAAAAGDALAREIVDRACRALGAGLGAAINSMNPEVVVVTGGVVKSLAALAGEIVRCTREYALPDCLDSTAIHFVPGDKRHTVRGGAALVLYERARRAGTVAS